MQFIGLYFLQTALCLLYGKDKEEDGDTAVLTEAEALRKEELARELLNVLQKVYPGQSPNVCVRGTQNSMGGLRLGTIGAT